jgi:RimJ/RimL family protein N-acetyltransferase
MLHPLKTSQFQIARHLFHKLEQYQPMCTSVLERVYPGRVFVDRVENPRTALLTTFIESEENSTWGFLAGEPTNENFNRTLNTAIFDRQVISPKTPVILLTCDPLDWGGHLTIVMAPRTPIWMPRWHYVCRQVRYDWKTALPDGFAVQPMDDSLSKRTGLDLPDDVRSTLEKWQRITSERFQDFGFITIDENGEIPVIAGWATIDFIANGDGDLGFFTQPNYRRRGLGTIAAAAALEHGFTNGLSQIHWTCDSENQGSIHTAEKLGLERLEGYQMALLVFDETEHLGNLAYFALQAKDFALSASAFEKAIELNPESPHFIYYEAAQAMAMTGNESKALVFLSQAVKRGWKDVEHAQQCEAFTGLKKAPEWSALIKRMKNTE